MGDLTMFKIINGSFVNTIILKFLRFNPQLNLMLNSKFKFKFNLNFKFNFNFKFISMFIFTFVLIGFFFFTQTLKANDDNPIWAQAKITPFELNSLQSAELKIDIEILEGYRAYAEKFHLEFKNSNGIKLGKYHVTPITEFFDETTKTKKRGVIGKASLVAAIETPEKCASSEAMPTLFLTFQACTKTYCLFPQTIEIPVLFKWLGPVDSLANINPSEVKPKNNGNTYDNTSDTTGDNSSKQNAVDETLSSASAPSSTFSILSALNLEQFDFTKSKQSQSFAFVLLTLFILGILTSFTPCIYPLIPITLSVLGREAHARSRSQSFLAASIYIIGMSLTYALLGVFAASSGALFGSSLSSPWVIGFVSLVFLLMSLSSFGLFEMALPSAVTSTLQSKKLSGYWGVFITGLISGVIAGPCVGPILVSVLTYIAQTQDAWLGFWALFSFSLGMGQLLLVVGLSSQALKMLPKSGAWMDGVKTFFGILLLAMAFYYSKSLFPLSVWNFLLGVALVALGSNKGAFNPIEGHLAQLRKGASWSLIVIGSLLIYEALWTHNIKIQTPPPSSSLPPSSSSEPSSFSSPSSPSLNNQDSSVLPDSAGWITFSELELEKALSHHSPILIDFYADWCAACHELDEKTFSTEAFKTASAKITRLRFDATNSSDLLDKLQKKYSILGLPTLIFYDSKGTLRPDLTVNKFVTPKELNKILSQL